MYTHLIDLGELYLETMWLVPNLRPTSVGIEIFNLWVVLFLVKLRKPLNPTCMYKIPANKYSVLQISLPTSVVFLV
jgi:hypothetical protein